MAPLRTLWFTSLSGQHNAQSGAGLQPECHRIAIQILDVANQNSDSSRGRGRRGRRTADDEIRRDQEFALQSGTVDAFNLSVESIEGGAGEIDSREADGGERRQRVLREGDVVEADDREILRYMEAFHIGGAENADGGHVIGADDGGGTTGELAQLLKAGDASLEGVVAFDDPLLLKRQTERSHSG